MMRFLVVCASIVAIAVFGDTPASPRPPLALYSWKPAGQPWCFALIHDPNRTIRRTEIINTAEPIVGIAALKSRLAATPRTTWAVMWRDDCSEHTLRYPLSPVRDDLIAFGKQHGLNIEIWPSLCE